MTGDTNPLGYGARLRVDTTSQTYRRELNDGLTVRAQSKVGHQVLGIGAATSATIRITWPNGATDCKTAAAGSTIALKRGFGLLTPTPSAGLVYPVGGLCAAAERSTLCVGASIAILRGPPNDQMGRGRRSAARQVTSAGQARSIHRCNHVPIPQPRSLVVLRSQGRSHDRGPTSPPIPGSVGKHPDVACPLSGGA